MPTNDSQSSEAKCNCRRCGQRIAFPPEMAGQDVTCPHCGKETTLFLPRVRKDTTDLNAPVPDNQMDEIPDGTKILFGIIGIAVVAIAIPLFLLIQHQNELAKGRQEYEEATDGSRRTFSEQMKAEDDARAADRATLWWEVTNGVASAQYEYATNVLYESGMTNWAVRWLKEAADQGYQPAIDLLAKLPDTE